MNEIYLTKLNTPEQDRAALIEKLDKIFESEQLVMFKHSWENNYFPMKSLKHFIENSPSYKSDLKDLIVWFCPDDECLCFKNVRTCRHFYVRLANKKYVEDFPYIYEGKVEGKNDYIIPIKFK